MRGHRDFWAITGDALDYALEARGLKGRVDRDRLLAGYRSLRAYPEVPAVLERLRGAGLATAILSNGEPGMLRDGAASAKIDGLLDHILSVEEVGVFKPAAEAYLLATQRLGLPAREVAFVSSNGWDAHGAAWFGFRVFWANRARAPREATARRARRRDGRPHRPAAPAARMTTGGGTEDGTPALRFADIEAAAARLAGVAVHTPLLESEALNRLVGGRLLLKAEPLQRTGTFKFRGAYNAIAQTAAPAVVAFSSGNHAQGVAMAARLLGKAATIVMPADAPAIKRAATEAQGATVVAYDRDREVREEIGARIAAETGAALIKPYDDPRVMAGQGTCGLEIAEQAQRLDVVLDAALVCCGGGGLTAGCATALAHLVPGIAIHACEPEGLDDTARSLRAGERVQNRPDSRSICDALLAPTPGELTFAVNRRLLAGGLVVSDAEVEEAMRQAFRHLKLVVEPGGAVALAAALTGRLDCRGRTVAVVLSGGNVDPALYARVLSAA